MSQTDKQNTGKAGENAAEMFLKKPSYKILERNYWKKWGEIDIVADRNGIIHFIEVKTVSRENLPEAGSDNYLPEDNIYPWKRQRLARVIKTYLLERRISEDRDWQIDSLAVYLNREGQV